jgi:hypothetical protein
MQHDFSVFKISEIPMHPKLAQGALTVCHLRIFSIVSMSENVWISHHYLSLLSVVYGDQWAPHTHANL